MFEASSILTRDVVTVREDTPILEAVRVLAENDITGVPVVSDDMTLVGIISEKDVLRLLYEEGAKNAVVRDYMTHNVVSFSEDTPLYDICESLINNGFRRIPILRDGKIAGIISRSDIIKFILKVRASTH
ncbi:MAG: CBS domain-containing protein, partial [Candidatus Hydrogenedentes bacterium]|nr:CBS domain-containing protein [Candidatus Hydrogenedentota bacterium]